MAAAKFLQWAMFWTFEKRTVDYDRELISAGCAGLQHPALPCHVKRSGRLAVIVAQESAEPLVTFDGGIRARLHFLRK